MLRRRRPLLGAAMLGGAAMAGRHSQRTQTQREDQDARIDQLEAQQAAAPPPPAAAPAPAPAAAAPSLTDQLKQLGDLKASGVLTDEEFDAAKQKLLAS
jgi:predicted Zn-dependent peptidase